MVWSLLVGLVIGIVAKFLMPGKDPGGFIITALLGVAGAGLAHFLGENVGWYKEGEPAGFIASVIGAALLLSIYRVYTTRHPSLPHTRGL